MSYEAKVSAQRDAELADEAEEQMRRLRESAARDARPAEAVHEVHIGGRVYCEYEQLGWRRMDGMTKYGGPVSVEVGALLAEHARLVAVAEAAERLNRAIALLRDGKIRPMEGGFTIACVGGRLFYETLDAAYEGLTCNGLGLDIDDELRALAALRAAQPGGRET